MSNLGLFILTPAFLIAADFVALKFGPQTLKKLVPTKPVLLQRGLLQHYDKWYLDRRF